MSGLESLNYPSRSGDKCGNPFQPQHFSQRYCHPSCRNSHYTPHPLADLLKCKECGKPFMPRSNSQKYCCASCTKRYCDNNTIIAERKCKLCDEIFYVKRSYRKQRFCSVSCSKIEIKTKSVELILCACGQCDILIPATDKKGCPRRYAPNHQAKGILHYDWKGVCNGALHTWVGEHLPKPSNCQVCYRTDKRLELSCVGEYSRNNLESNWKCTCHQCNMLDPRSRSKEPDVW